MWECCCHYDCCFMSVQWAVSCCCFFSWFVHTSRWLFWIARSYWVNMIQLVMAISTLTISSVTSLNTRKHYACHLNPSITSVTVSDGAAANVITFQRFEGFANLGKFLTPWDLCVQFHLDIAHNLTIFRLDALALSVIATATCLAGWLAGWLGVRHTPVLYQNG